MRKLFLIVLFISLNTLLFAKDNWKISISEDEMTGDKSVYIMSMDSHKSTKPMSFPYSETSVTMAIGMDGTDEWLYLYFDKEPNLVNTKIEDGYNRINSRVKFDDDIQEVVLTQSWGSQALHFAKAKKYIKQLTTVDEVLIELQWYGQDNIYFKIPTAGLSKYLQKAKDEF